MKNRRLFRIMMIMAAVIVPLLASSQVKQVFKVVDFETGKPIAGATSSLYGQKLVTDAKGVAVANLSADKKGAYLPVEQWRKEGLYYIGRLPSSYSLYYQTSDTIGFCMVETAKYRKELEEQAVRLYRYWYDDAVMEYISSMRDSIRKNPDRATALANAMVGATIEANNGTPLRWRYSDAEDINRYDMCWFEKPKFAEVLKVLRSGNADSAVAMAKGHIDTTDNSVGNLEWIYLYKTLRSLYICDEDESPLSDYTVYLYKNRFSLYEAGEYVQDLNRDGRYELADSICRIEKPNNRNPRFSSTFEPSWFRYLIDRDNAKMKAAAETSLNTNKSVYGKYPFFKTLGDLYWISKNLYRVYVTLQDSVSATRTIDSAMVYLKQYLKSDNGDDYFYTQGQIMEYLNVLDALNADRSYISEQTVAELYDTVFDAAKRNYEKDTASLFLKLQLAECALSWLQNSPGMDKEENVDRENEVLTTLNDVLTRMSGEFSEYFLLQNIQVSAQLVANCLTKENESKEAQDAFRRFERSYDLASAEFPGFFENTYLRYNGMFESYLTSGQLYSLTNELADFSERLLKVKAGNDPQKLLVLKAEQANTMAETLFADEAYDEAIGYYMQANEFYQKALPNDEQLWMPYLTNYLQMGDAHLFQNQYDKAVMTYQKILDYESRIPASMMPRYTAMKGNVNYYVGDVYKSTGDVKRADKEYKTAEKWFKKAVAMGDTLAYQSLGEMYLAKAVLAANQNDMKKCKQLLETSVVYYEKCAMDRPLTRYERAKVTLGVLYERDGEDAKYYENLKGLNDFYRKFVDMDEDYAAGLVQSAEAMLNSGTVTNEEALTYSKDIVDGIIALDYAGNDVDLPYLRSLFNLAKVYSINDSVEKAIGIYKDCINVSEYMFADTDMETHSGNLIEIYKRLADCYEVMAKDIDTAHSELWYYRAIDIRDSLIDMMKGKNDGDVNQTYQTAIQYRKNGVVSYHLDMIPSAQDCLDKSNELLMMLYNSEFESEVEDDVIQNYFLKGVIYLDNDNEEKGVENLRKAVAFGERAKEVSPYYIASLGQLIELLEKDKAANADEIAKLTKKLKEQSKKLK